MLWNSLRERKRELQRVEVPRLLGDARWILFHDDPPEHGGVSGIGVIRVARSVDVEKLSPANAVKFAVAHEVGGDKSAQFHEQLTCDGLITTGAFRLGDEAEELFGIARG